MAKTSEDLKPRDVVIIAYKYLADITPPSQKISGVRIEELIPKGSGAGKYWIIVLSYDTEGEFPFDRKREYKEFKITNDEKVVYMKDKRNRDKV